MHAPPDWETEGTIGMAEILHHDPGPHRNSPFTGSTSSVFPPVSFSKNTTLERTRMGCPPATQELTQ